MPRTVKPAPERKAEIVEAAQNLFITQGYDATSVNQVIEAVGISKGAFYHHFTAKEDLLEAIAQHHVAQTAADAQSVLDDPTLDSFARLKKFLEMSRERKVNEGVRVIRTFQTLFHVDNVTLFHRIHTAMIEVIKPVLTRIIAEGVEEQTFDTSSPEGAAETILLLGTTTREAVARIVYATNGEERAAAATALMEKMEFICIVMDRVLGLPDGSLDLGKADFVNIISACAECTDLQVAAE